MLKWENDETTHIETDHSPFSRSLSDNLYTGYTFHPTFLLLHSTYFMHSHSAQLIWFVPTSQIVLQSTLPLVVQNDVTSDKL